MYNTSAFGSPLTISVANPETCSNISFESRLADTRALGSIMAGLMDEPLDDETVVSWSGGIPSRAKKSIEWPAEVIDFMTLTMTAPASELAEVRLLSPETEKEADLIAPVCQTSGPTQRADFFGRSRAGVLVPVL